MIEEGGGGASRSTDPASGSSAATDVSLREYVTLMVGAETARLNQRFDAVERATQQAFENSQRAIDKADAATEKRFEGVNEFRAALEDQAARFVTGEQLAAVAAKLEAGYVRNREDIDGLVVRIERREGETAGSRLTYGNMAALIAVTGTMLGIVIVVANYVTG